MTQALLIAATSILPAGRADAIRPAIAPPPREAAVHTARAAEVFPVPLTIALCNPWVEVTAVNAGSITVRTLFHQTEGVKLQQSNEADTERLYLGSPLVVRFATRAVACTQLRANPRRLTLTLQNGQEEVIRLEDQPAVQVRYDADAPYTGWEPHTHFSYRPQDVRVGDFVSLKLTWVGGEHVCKWICINRRPGGQVPPAPGQDEDEVQPWHLSANEQQAFEDYGIPLTTDEERQARYKARYKAREARLEKEAERRAPPPREAKPKPPAP